ncbi:MAG TPA: hypothetical protein VHS96_09380 [Bacteroidia bacterium]|nr:hypothetical protein [Bacteroidia bacterium]
MFSLRMQAQVTVSNPEIDAATHVLKFSFVSAKPGPLPLAQDFKVAFPYNQAHTITVSGSDSTGITVTAGLPEGVFPGTNDVEIFYQKKSVWKNKLTVPDFKVGPDEQPLVESVSPSGGFATHAISVKGKNFGDNLGNIYVWLGGEDGKPFDAHINPIPVSFLSTPDASGSQEIRFYYPSLPTEVVHEQEKEPAFWLSRQHRIWVFVGGQPSATAKEINLVNDNYRRNVFLIAFVLFAVISVLLWWLFKLGKGDSGTWYSIVIDTTTNRISLPKVQILAWSMLLGFGYTYYALIRWLVMDDGTIPDFPGSLLILLGISSGGSLIASTQNTDLRKSGGEGPRLRDLVSIGPEISLSRLQLVVFTIITMALYITYLSDEQLAFLGMPEVPTNLLLLMGLSQGGSIVGNTVEGKANALSERESQENASKTETPTGV